MISPAAVDCCVTVQCSCVARLPVQAVSLWVDAFTSLTLTVVPVGCKLVPGLTGTSVAAQCVDAALLTLAVVRTGAFVHLWHNKKKKKWKKKITKVISFVISLCMFVRKYQNKPLKKLAENPALLTEPSDTNLTHSWLLLLLTSTDLSSPQKRPSSWLLSMPPSLTST